MVAAENITIPIDIFPDDVFLVSYPKSGRTWVRFLIANYLSGNKCNFLNSYLIVPSIDYNPERCISVQRPRFIQSHWSFTPEFKRVIFIVRDGRDVAVSYYFHLIKFRVINKNTKFEDYMNSFNAGGLDNLPPWGTYINLWLDNAPKNFLVIKYEDLQKDTVKELTKILEFAQIIVDNNAVLSAVESSKFENMRRYEESGDLYDELAKTDLSIPHVRVGKVGRYKDYFNDTSLSNFIKNHGLALERLGYIHTKYSEINRQMIEINNPEINVDELMKKIKQEVANRSNIPLEEDTTMSSIEPINTLRVTNIEALINDAEFNSQPATKWPDKFNRFPFNWLQPLQKFLLKIHGFIFKKQRVVDAALIQALRESLNLNRQLTQQLATLQEQFNEMRDRLTVVDEQIATTEGRLNTTEGRLNTTEGRLNTTEGRLNTTEGDLTAAKNRLIAMDDRYIRNDSFLKNDLAQQKRLISMFLEEARQRLPQEFNSEQLQTFVSQNQHLLDAFYVAFEEEFRGSRQVIVDRLKVYLPLIEETKICTELSPIVDVGCGRGEWLELLRESGYIAKGIDNNRVMVEQCQARGLEVSEFDVIDYLKSLPDDSLGGVTGFHIIEHLPFLVLIKLLNETHRVLQSGGLAIFETPNPQNILVGANNFYTDPTHRNPLPSNLTKFMMENTGFASVKIMNLNPYDESFQLNGSEVADRFNEYFYGPQDYAAIGYKI